MKRDRCPNIYIYACTGPGGCDMLLVVESGGTYGQRILTLVLSCTSKALIPRHCYRGTETEALAQAV